MNFPTPTMNARIAAAWSKRSVALSIALVVAIYLVGTAGSGLGS